MTSKPSVVLRLVPALSYTSFRLFCLVIAQLSYNDCVQRMLAYVGYWATRLLCHNTVVLLGLASILTVACEREFLFEVTEFSSFLFICSSFSARIIRTDLCFISQYSIPVHARPVDAAIHAFVVSYLVRLKTIVFGRTYVLLWFFSPPENDSFRKDFCLLWFFPFFAA